MLSWSSRASFAEGIIHIYRRDKFFAKKSPLAKSNSQKLVSVQLPSVYLLLNLRLHLHASLVIMKLLNIIKRHLLYCQWLPIVIFRCKCFGYENFRVERNTFGCGRVWEHLMIRVNIAPVIYPHGKRRYISTRLPIHVSIEPLETLEFLWQSNHYQSRSGRWLISVSDVRLGRRRIWRVAQIGIAQNSFVKRI